MRLSHPKARAMALGGLCVDRHTRSRSVVPRVAARPRRLLRQAAHGTRQPVAAEWRHLGHRQTVGLPPRLVLQVTLVLMAQRQLLEKGRDPRPHHPVPRRALFLRGRTGEQGGTDEETLGTDASA